MSKLKKATKRITAVAASVGIVAGTAMAGGLGSYPSNFVKDDQFDGKVVVGASAATIDTTSANAVIEDLKDEFSGENEKVKITYKSDSEEGESISAIKSNEVLNYGENLGDVTEISGFDDADSDMLEDKEFKNGISNEDYKQTLTLKNGAFNYALRDSVADEIKEGLYYEDGKIFAEYLLDLDNGIDLTKTGSDSLDDKMLGETLTIMGNEFTISKIKDSSGALDEITLVGGSNKVALSEGEEVTKDGVDIEVLGIYEDSVQISVGGENQLLDLYDSEKVGGKNIVVTSIAYSGKEATTNYVEIVVGGQEVLLQNGKEVQVDGEDVSDVYEDYYVQSDFTGSSVMDEIKLTYKVEDDILLEKGDSLDDVLFDSFSLVYDGTNEPDYTDIKVDVNDDDVDIKGTTEDGEDLTLSVHIETGTLSSGALDATEDPQVYLKGDQDSDRIFFRDSNISASLGDSGIAAAKEFNVTTGTQNTSTIDIDGVTYSYVTTDGGDDNQDFSSASDLKTELEGDGHSVYVSSNVVTVATTDVTGSEITVASSSDFLSFDLTDNGIKGSGFLLTKDNEEQYLYELTSVDTLNSKHEVDFDEWLRADDESDIERTEWGTDLGKTMSNDIYSANYTGIKLTDLNDNVVAFENEIMLSLADEGANTFTIEDVGADTDATIGSEFVIGLDKDDMDADEADEEGDAIKFGLGWDSTDEEFDINALTYTQGTPGGDDYTDANYSSLAHIDAAGEFMNNGMEDNKDGDSDVQTFVTKYGIKVEYDNDKKKSATISVPDEQVEAKVNLVFGETSEEKTVTVDADQVEDKKDELKEDGYTIVDEETIESEEVSFDVESVSFDNEVSGTEDMIVVGGPAVNSVARELMGIDVYTIDQAGVDEGEGIIKYFEDSNSVLVYGYSGEDTAEAVAKLNEGGLADDDEVNV